MRVEPGQDKSHTYCKRHYIAMVNNTLETPPDPEQQQRAQNMIAQANSRPDESFPPDLQKHPELVDQEGAEKFHTDMDQKRQALGQETRQRLRQ